MFFGEIKTKLSLGGILSSSIAIDNDKNKIKFSKGTIIDENLVDLLLLNNVENIRCAKLDDDEIDENTAVHEISKKLITSKKSFLKIQDPKNGRCNLVSSVDGILTFQPNQLFSINSVTNDIGIASLKAFSKVKKNQIVASIKAIPFGIKNRVGTNIAIIGMVNLTFLYSFISFFYYLFKNIFYFGYV